MPKIRRSRRGSLQYWPRKRCKRVYPEVNWKSLKSDKAKPVGFAAYKAGMTRLVCVKDGKAFIVPVTVLDAPPIFVCGIRYYSGSRVLGESWAEKVPKGLERKTGKAKERKSFDYESNSSRITDARLIACAQPEKSGMKKIKPELFEIGLGGKASEKIEYAKSVIGKEVDAADVFRAGDYCDVTAVTKGHGFTGAVKRFGIRIQGRKDEQHHRHPGSVGSTTPRKIDWRVPMPGQYGFFQRTEHTKRVILIDSDGPKVNPSAGWENYGLIKGKYILVEGSIPGPAKRLIFMTAPRRTSKYAPVEVRKILK